MTEEMNPENQETQHIEEPEEATKLLIDKPSDFKFHAAYLAYSEAWDSTTLQSTKNELNDLLNSLSKDDISYSNFYRTLDDYRQHERRHQFSRDKIETQRKRDWRNKQNKRERNSRYRKH